MALTRGDLVTVVLRGDYGKPRPALVVQSDRFAALASFVVLPITSTLIEAPMLRLTLEPSEENGLRTTSQIMIDKPMAVKADRLGLAFGRLDGASMVRVSRSLALFLGLAG